MGYFEYRDLAPIDNIENGDKYIEALNWAFQNKKVKNIALTGPYGAGKSSVIETFLAQDDKKNNKGFPFRANTIRKKSLKISMATFFKGKALENAESGEKIEVDADEVEKGILKQLFYKVEPGKIPQSRYRKIHKIKLSPVMVHIFGAMTLITFLSAIFAPEKYNTFVQTINNFLSIESAPNIKTYSFMGILFLVTAGVIAYLYRTVISRFRIKEVKLPSDTTIQSGREESDSVFNKNLDEIMYFFEATGYRIVFFEDLDRLDSPKIFVHLRELNNLLNNDDAIKGKPIVFVYAVRDDIFSKEDRTKFFDFIIPIVPVINETNSGEILLQRFQEAKGKGVEHNISQEFVLDVSPYVSDMRVFAEYAESCMTAGVAMKMAALKLPVTKDIADAAMDCVGQQDKSEILFANIGVYGAGELPRKFNELGGIYANLADRTKRHEVLLPATLEYYSLAEYLKNIGYITSVEEKIEKQYDAALEKEKTQKFLKLRIKKA